MLAPVPYKSERQRSVSLRFMRTSLLIWDALTADDAEHKMIVAKIKEAHERHGTRLHKYRDVNQLGIYLLMVFIPVLQQYGWRTPTPLEICATGVLYRRFANSLNIHFDDLPKDRECDGLIAYHSMMNEAGRKEQSYAYRSRNNRYLAEAWMDAASPSHFRQLFQVIWKSLVPTKYLSIIG